MNDIVYELSWVWSWDWNRNMRKRRTCYLLRCWSELFCSSARASPAYIRSAIGRECSRHDRDSCWARAALSCAQQPIKMRPCGRWWLRTKSTREQESRREREGEYLERALCIFQIFKVDSWLAFFGHAKIFSCSPLSLAPAPSFSLFVACTLPAIPVKFLSRTSRNLSEKKTRNSTHYPKMPGDGTRTRRRTMHYLANDLCCWIAKYLLVPFHWDGTDRDWQSLSERTCRDLELSEK